ncbi:MAG: hypothetical protein RLZZ227_2394 [Pseudomonadota bacterium]
MMRTLAPGHLLRCAVLLCAALASALALGDERILSFHSDIDVAVDGSMTVTETIRVRAEGVNIRRGIYRDFPTRYRDRAGNAYRVGFRVVRLTRDGRPEPWSDYERQNGVRVDFGNDEFLPVPADYEYQLQYRTNRQLGFFEDHDELYWNMTGNGWDFVIDAASATVTLPAAVPAAQLAMEGYTGSGGEQGQDYTAATMDGAATITTTRPLNPREGLTLVLSWPKGIVTQPTRTQRARYLLDDNQSIIVALVTLIAAGIWLGRAWARVGRDPEPGVIFPHYEPPSGFSPAAARYLERMGYDSKTLGAAVINLAVAGYVHITQQNKKYVLQRQASERPLAADEQALLARLFAAGDVLELQNSNHALVSAAMSAHASVLKKLGVGKYFLNNTRYVVPSLLGSLAMFVLALVFGGLVPVAFGLFVIVFILHVVFGFLLRAPTLEGRQVLDKFEGFKLYLDVAEKDEMNLRNPPQLTPQLFEKYLPFAIALGVEQAWSERFERVLAGLQEEQRLAYHPIWYSGHFSPGHMSDFTREVGKGFNSAISSAATAPGTSSGAGGGGFSGGGGGGGGGGGR